MEQTTNAEGGAEKRPTFLTVLCILSFIAAGFAIVGYVLLITAMGAVSSLASGLEDLGGEATYTGPSVAMTWTYIIVGFVTVLISLFGVIKMWKLQKIGFYLYVAANVISIVMGIIYSGFGVTSLVFPAVFIVLYGLNLKHLK